MSKLAPVAAAAASLVLVAAAPPSATSPVAPDEPAARQCFRPQTVRNYAAQDDTTVYVRARGQVFEVQTTGCRGLSLSRTLGLTPQRGGRACVGDALTVATAGPSTMGENNSICAGRVTRQLTEAEIEGLPSRLRP